MEEGLVPGVPFHQQDAYWERLLQPETGYVYFLGAFDRKTEELHLIKIGYSKQPRYRMGQISGRLGLWRGEELAVVPGGQSREYAYHKAFKEHSTSGEWFLPARPILDEIERLTGTKFVEVFDEADA